MKSTRQFMTQAECDQIASLLGRKHTSFLRQRFFEVSVRKDSHGVYAKVIFRSRDGSFYYPVEARAAHMDHDLDEAAAAQLLCEYIGEYFAEYFQADNELYLPIDWADYVWEGMPLQMRGQILNLEAERLADELLSNAVPSDAELH